MSLHHIANHLAAKGRHGDTTLVHMTKDEVAGLKALARKNGTPLTTNPHTGLPEAFGLKALIPIAAGIALGPAGFGIASSAMGAGLMVGGATALATGSLKQGLVAGLGAYGGAGLAGSGAAAAGEGAVAGEGATAGSATANQAPVFETTATPAETIQAGGQAAPATQQYAGAYQPTSFSNAPADLATETQAYSATPTNYSAFGDAPAPVDSGTTVADATQQQASASYGTAQPVSSTTASTTPTSTFDRVAANAEANPKYLGAAVAPAMVEDMTPKPYNPPERKVDADMGQRLGYNSGYDNSIPGRVSTPSYYAMSDEAAKKQYGFAEGGDVQYPAGESVMRMAEGGQANAVGYGTNYAPGQQFGRGIDYSGYDVAPNQGVVALPAARTSALAAPENGYIYDPMSQTYVGSSPSENHMYKGAGEYGLEEAALKKAAEQAAAAVTGYDGSGGAGYAGGGNIQFSGDPSQAGGPIGDLFKQLAAKGLGAETRSGDTGTGYTYDATTKQYTPNMAAGGGISGLMNYAGGGSLGGYSDGGRMLKGPGDGMSDNIPATIGGKQPARLADGEFVVPADVVSHLGNGSTDAGAKQLYKMMDKVRQARTGRKSQGKKINPNRYTPA